MTVNTALERGAHLLGDAMEDMIFRALPSARAGGPTDLSRCASQPKALIPNASKKCRVCNGTGFASSIPMTGRICTECRGSGRND